MLWLWTGGIVWGVWCPVAWRRILCPWQAVSPGLPSSQLPHLCLVLSLGWRNSWWKVSYGHANCLFKEYIVVDYRIIGWPECRRREFTDIGHRSPITVFLRF
ncbi:hypothetical protein HOY82DRAFT_552036 [Tuber indicum]|nr:hypothetical protein HOY82DRAFT_552036 [Tuber indicum]